MIKKLQQLKAKKGFTLVELIVVIAIIGVLAAILIPTMLGFVTSSRVTSADTTANEIAKLVDQFLTDADTKQYGMLKGSTVIQDFEVTATTAGGTTTWDVSAGDAANFQSGGSIGWGTAATGVTTGQTKVGVTNAETLLGIQIADAFPSITSAAISIHCVAGDCVAVWYTADTNQIGNVTMSAFGTTPTQAWATDPYSWDNSTAGITVDGFIVGTSPKLNLG